MHRETAENGEGKVLYLTRKVGQSILIDGDIEITLVEVRGKTAKLGFTFPDGRTVLRRELHERIQAENGEDKSDSTAARNGAAPPRTSEGEPG